MSALCFAGALWCAPIARWVSTSHNFGAFSEEDGPQTTTFELINDGDSPMVILSGRATCGCTTPIYPKSPIAPGDTAIIRVTYDPDSRPGRFSKAVYIETNTEPSRSRLDIKGVVIGSGATIARKYPLDLGPLKLAQRAFVLGEVDKGHLKTVYFDGYNRSSDSLRVQIVSKPSWIDITVAPEAAPPGEQLSLLAYVNSAKCPLYGLVEDSVTIAPRPGEEYTVPLTLLVKEDFSTLSADKLATAPVAALSERTLELGKVARSGASVTAKFSIGNAGHNPLHLRRVYSSDPGISIAIDGSETIKKGKHTNVSVTVDPSAFHTDIISARVNVITDDPLHPTQTIRVAGILK